MKTVVRLLGPDDSLEELTGLLNRAYKSLADMGLNYVASWQGVDITKRRLENALCFVVEIDGRIVGTIFVGGRRPRLPLSIYAISH